MIDITQIVVAVIGLLGIILTSVVVPLIKSKITSTQWDTILNYAIAGVQAAEIIFTASVMALSAPGTSGRCRWSIGAEFV